jgi:hypothetical protein
MKRVLTFVSMPGGNAVDGVRYRGHPPKPLREKR